MTSEDPVFRPASELCAVFPATPNRLATAQPCRYLRPMGESRVDIQHLLEDLRDAYSGSLEETILTEIVANALDSGARRIDLALI